jgi:polyribonucleotide nucleotidyltransferase
MSKEFTFSEAGYRVDIDSYAQQADGSAWLQQGGTIVLSTVVQDPAEEFPGFLPLTVDYREQFSAAGKIPGGYFKREGKWTDKEVLTARLIDRAIRPLFPEKFFNQVQVYNLLLSYDQEHSPTALGLLATSIALSVSPIAFLGPVGAVEVLRIDGTWHIDPSQKMRKTADARLVVAGTADGICMVEGGANGLSESDLVEALFLGHAMIKKQVARQEQIIASRTIKKEPYELNLDWDSWHKRVQEYLTIDRVQTLFKAGKLERNEARKVLQDEFFAQYTTTIEETEISQTFVEYIFNTLLKVKVTDQIFKNNKRIDGRTFTTVRPLNVQVGLLPFAHGSSLFMRGNTQALTTATLGSSEDEPRTELLIEEGPEKNFILHYNFPPFSVGEVRPMRGPSRRDIGHGNLATTAIMPILPEKNDFPYTMRVVTDILGSDGSSSMATVCGSTMALMDAGIPISAMVSGVAMGLLRSNDGTFQALTDISGFEDEFGLMDFKVAGTSVGITAIQMDIKYKEGLPRSVFEQALAQARDGRAHILDHMKKIMQKPRPELSPLVPKIISFLIDPDKTGAVIGTGGKVIREITTTTNTTIDIENGKVNIFGGPEADIDRAVQWVKVVAGQIDIGTIFQGKVVRLAEFGVFVELVPGQMGLVHISAIERSKQNNLDKEFPIGSQLVVKVKDYDSESGRIRLVPTNEKPDTNTSKKTEHVPKTESKKKGA